MSLTIAIIGNTNHRLMELALEKTIKAVPHDDVLVFCDKNLNLSKNHKFFELPKDFGLIDYMNLSTYTLGKHIETNHVMLIQYDGFAVNKSKWSDKFLEYDYIGPLISPNHPPVKVALEKIQNIPKTKRILDENRWIAGGGGFSIRSKRYLDIISQKGEKDFSISLPYDTGGFWWCDDVILHYYEEEKLKKENLKVAPINDSMNFAVEINSGYDFTLGFHGWFNIPLFLNENEIYYFMENFKNKSKLVNEEEQGKFLGFLWTKGYKNLFKKYYDQFEEINKTKQKTPRFVKVWP